MCGNDGTSSTLHSRAQVSSPGMYQCLSAVLLFDEGRYAQRARISVCLTTKTEGQSRHGCTKDPYNAGVPRARYGSRGPDECRPDPQSHVSSTSFLLQPAVMDGPMLGL